MVQLLSYQFTKHKQSEINRLECLGPCTVSPFDNSEKYTGFYSTSSNDFIHLTCNIQTVNSVRPAELG